MATSHAFTGRVTSQSTLYLARRALDAHGAADSRLFGLAIPGLIMLASPSQLGRDAWEKADDHRPHLDHCYNQLLRMAPAVARVASPPVCPPPPGTPELRLRWSRGAVPEVEGTADAGQLLAAAEVLRRRALSLIEDA